MAADIIIAILAAAMVAYTIYRLFFSKKNKSCCGDCSKCAGCLKTEENNNCEGNSGNI